MKKNCIISKSRFLFLSLAVLLCSCDNFLGGSVLKKELEEAITEASKEKCDVSIFSYSSQGTLTGEKGGTYSAGTESLKLNFTENTGWQFVEWQVYNSNSQKSGCSSADVISIQDPYSKDTFFSVKNGADKYKIEAVCMARPLVENFSPLKINGGVNADSSIEIIFAQGLSSNSFVFTQQEFETYGRYAQAIRENPGDDSSAIIGINLAGMRFFKNIQILDSDGKGLEKHYNAPVLSADGKTLTLYSDNSNLFDFTSSDIKDVYVTLASDTGYDYTLQNGVTVKVKSNESDYNFSYRVTSTTTDKARIIFSNKNDDGEITGTLNYSGTREFNIGQSFKVEFIPSADFDFVSWNISNPENLVTSENGNELLVTAMDKVTDVVIKPVCQKKGTTTFTVSTNIGNVIPAGTVTAKAGEVVTLTYSGDGDYYFPGWAVMNSAIDEVLSREQLNEFFECADLTKNTIDVRVKSESHSFEFVANSYLRPHVFSHEPANTEDGVTQDTNVRIYFDSEIDEKTLYFTTDEEYNITKKDPLVVFKSDSKGKYAYTLSNGQFYYKNFTIENRVTGENLSKYYGRPYLIDKKTMILPVNKVKNAEGTLDKDKLPPGGIQIFIQLGTDFGFYAEGNLIPLARDTNLTWIYSTKKGVDEKLPSIPSFTAKGTNNTAGFDAYTKTTLPNNKNLWQACYLKDNKLHLDAELKDESKNLFEVYLNYKRVQNENLLDVSEEEQRHSLSFRKDTQNFYVENVEVDLKELSGKDGTYELYLSAIDDAGNKCQSNKFYARIDKTAPVLSTEKYKVFKTYGKIKFRWNVPSNNDLANHSENHDLEKIELYIDDTKKQTENSTSIDGIYDTIITPSQNGKYKFVAYDIFGNKTEAEFDYDMNIPYGSVLYSDQWTLDWWNYVNCSINDYATGGIFAVGHVGHNSTVNDSNIYIFNISDGDKTHQADFKNARDKAKEENNRINLTFRNNHSVEFKLPTLSNYEKIFGNENSYAANYNFMVEKLSFDTSSSYGYWTETYHGSSYLPNGDCNYTYNTIVLGGRYLSIDWGDETVPYHKYRFISNFKFTE